MLSADSKRTVLLSQSSLSRHCFGGRLLPQEKKYTDKFTHRHLLLDSLLSMYILGAARGSRTTLSTLRISGVSFLDPLKRGDILAECLDPQILRIRKQRDKCKLSHVCSEPEASTQQLPVLQ